MNELRQPQSRLVLPTISVVTFFGFLDTTLLLPVLALYASGLGASIGVVGLIIGLYSIMNTPANILFGRLVDRIGYKIPLVVGLIGDALAMFFYSLCRLPIHLALVRALHGTSGGLIGPATMSGIVEHSGDMNKGKVMGIYGMSIAVATLVGFGLSGVIVSRLDYQALFLFGAMLLAIGVVLGLLLPSSKRGGMTAQISLAKTFQQVRSLITRKGINLAYSSIFAQYFTFGGIVTLLPIHVNKLGMEAFHVGMLLATFAIMFIIVQFPSGAFSDKVGRVLPTVCGLGLGIVSLVTLPWLTTFPLLVVAMASYGVAYGLLFPSISALVVDHTLPEERGLASGVFHALLTAGVALGAPIIGWVGQGVGVPMALLIAPAIMVLALGVALSALKRT